MQSQNNGPQSSESLQSSQAQSPRLFFGVDLETYNNYPGPGEMSRALSQEIEKLPSLAGDSDDTLARATWMPPRESKPNEHLKKLLIDEPVLAAGIIHAMAECAKTHGSPEEVCKQLVVTTIYALQIGMVWERLRQAEEVKVSKDLAELEKLMYG